jgi:Fe-S cluster assembly protein SufD
MTVTHDPATQHVAGAVESVPAGTVESHLHPVSSFDLADHPMPTGREEIWRFTPLKRLRGALDEVATDDGPTASEHAATYESVGPQEYFAGTLAPGEAPRGSALVPDDRASAIASRLTEKALHVRVPADTVVEEVLGQVVTAQGGRRSNAHHVIEAGPHSRFTYVLDHRGSGVHAANLEVVVGDGADVTVVSIQDWDDDAVHVGTHEAVVGRDARYKHVMVTFGGDVVRLNANVSYAGPGGEAELLGLYFADAGQHIEHRLFADHNQPRTKSNVVYKGALQGERAHTVWVGNVLIRKVAEGIETYEENRNLVLSDGCQADSVPNLEIETGEIEGAGHASATARFDDEQLFYLRSRGVSDKEARRLVLHGFFDDLIRKVGVPSLAERLTATVEAELAKNVLRDLEESDV